MNLVARFLYLIIVLLFVSFTTSCATTSTTRTDAKGVIEKVETKSFDTGVGTLFGQLIQGVTGAKPPKAPKAPAAITPTK